MTRPTKPPADWAARLAPAALARIAAGLVVGALGGALAAWAGVPLAWMIGALFAAMVAAISGLPVDVPVWVRTRFLVILGLFLGENIGGLDRGQVAEWPATIALAMLYVPVAAGLAYLFFRHLARIKPLDAAFSSIPGGITAVVLVATALGADERRVGLIQSLRLTLVVMLAPAVAFGAFGLTEADAGATEAVTVLGGGGILMLLAAGMGSTWLFEKMRVPVPFLIGPILVSILMRQAGLVEGVLPIWLVDVALVVTGASIGTRFAGTRWGTVAQLGVVTVAATVVMLLVTVAFAAIAWLIVDVDFLVALLAYAPGGLAEMALIALAIDSDPGFVAVHHAARILLILIGVPVIAGIILRRRAAEERIRARRSELRSRK